MMTRRLLAWLAIASLTAPLLSQDVEVPISGRVVDGDGNPVAQATVSTSWPFNREELEPGMGGGRKPGEALGGTHVLIGGGQRELPAWQLGRGVETDRAGRFDGLFRKWQSALVLLVYSRDRKLAGTCVVPDEPPEGGVEIVLRPTVRVQARYSCKDLERDSVSPLGYIDRRVDGKRVRLGSAHSNDGRLDVLLPPGPYVLHVYGKDMDSIYRPLDVPEGRAELDLGTVDIPASFFALQRGKVLPEWNVTAARGLPEGATSLESLRGKWLVVEFWGFW